MKRKIVLIFLATLTISMLSGCGNSETANSGTSANTQTENDNVEQIGWTPLNEQNNHQDTLRLPFEEVFYTKLNEETGEKEGHLYRDSKGYTVQNNTLYGVLTNTTAKQIFQRDSTKESLVQMVENTYVDIEDADENDKFYIAINSYFGLLPDRDETHCDYDSTLSTAEFMAMLMRAETPVDDNLSLDKEFISAVGLTEYNLYAQQVANHAYINTSDKSLNSTTFNGNITRAEAIYLLMNHYFGEGNPIDGVNELTNLDLKNLEIPTEFTDAKNGGDIKTSQGYTGKDNASAYTLQYAINNTAEGLPTDIYKALVLASNKGLLESGTETRWDDTITKSEAIEFIYKALRMVYTDTSSKDTTVESADNKDTNKTENNTGNTNEKYKDHSYYLTEWGTFDYGWEEAGITEEEDLEDGWLGFTVHKDEGEEWSYLTYNKDGTRYDVGDRIPTVSGFNGLYLGADGEEVDRYMKDPSAWLGK